MEDLRVGVACMNAAPREVKRNLDRIQNFALSASAEGADVVCFPELSVTGYLLRQPADCYRDMGPAEAVEGLLEISRDARVVIIAGLIEPAGDARPYITQIIAGPEGLIGMYRKTHLSPPETSVFQAGQEIRTFFIKNCVIGIQLCYEAHFPEISTIMAVSGADILFFPHASPRGNPEGKLKSWLRHLTARAFDNGTFLVACNQVGKSSEGYSFPGVLVVLGPDGNLLAKYTGNEEKLLIVNLKEEQIRAIRQHRMKYFLPKRRPELYQDISRS